MKQIYIQVILILLLAPVNKHFRNAPAVMGLNLILWYTINITIQ